MLDKEALEDTRRIYLELTKLSLLSLLCTIFLFIVSKLKSKIICLNFYQFLYYITFYLIGEFFYLLCPNWGRNVMILVCDQQLR